MISDAFTALFLECIVRSSLVTIAAAAILFMLRVRDPRVRQRVWAALTVWMLILPLWTAWGPRAPVHVPVASSTTAFLEIHSMRATPSATAAISRATAGTPSVFHWSNLLLAVYPIFAAAFFARLMAGTLAARRLRNSAVLVDGRWTSESWSVPVTVGLFAPRIILPAGWTEWPSAQLDAVLLHEAEHADRRDPLVQWIALLNRAVFWFHPVAWFLERRITALAEEGCDAAVLARGHDPMRYSGYLLEMARLMQRQGGRLVGSAAMCNAYLQRRIRRILASLPPATHHSRARTALVFAASAVLTAIGAAAAIEPAGPTALAAIALPKPLIHSPAVALSTTVQARPTLVRKRRPVLLAQAQAAPTSKLGSIFGTVEDAAGARVPNAAITVSDAAGAIVASAHSDPAGAYRIEALAPGSYTVEFTARGFAKRTVSTGVTEGKSTHINAGLELGQIYQTVEVNATRPRNAGASTPSRAPAKAPITVGGSVRAARLVKLTQPVYPPELRNQGIEGTVILRALISSEGVPINVHVLNDDEIDPRLAEAALEAVKTWRYEPTRLDEQPVDTRTTIEISFRLDH